MRFVRWVIGPLALVLAALWYFSVDQPEVVLPVASPTPSAPSTAPSPERVETTPEGRPELEREPAEEPEDGGRSGRVPTCRPNLLRGEGPPLELTLTGQALPDAPPKSTSLEVSWIEDGQPRRWFIRLSDWKTTFWPCDEGEVAVRRGPYRLQRTRVPRAGAISLFVEKASAPSEVTVRTVRRGAAVAGVRVSLTGCDPLLTGDGGVAVTSCEEVDEPRRAGVRAPWRVATSVLVPPDATEVTVPVLGVDEVEPGRVGLGFAQGATTPVVRVLMDGGPAQRSGVRVGDEVLEVDGIGVATVEETMPRIIGVPGSTVRFKLRRGQDVLLLDVVRTPE